MARRARQCRGQSPPNSVLRVFTYASAILPGLRGIGRSCAAYGAQLSPDRSKMSTRFSQKLSRKFSLNLGKLALTYSTPT